MNNNLSIKDLLEMSYKLSDVLMYFIDSLNRFGISEEEFSNVYYKKYKLNLTRNFMKDHSEYIHLNLSSLK